MLLWQREKPKAILSQFNESACPDSDIRSWFIEYFVSSRAEKYRDKVLSSWSKKCWLDMGMATIIFTVHTDCNGRLIADV
jgi:hypothetical protein